MSRAIILLAAALFPTACSKGSSPRDQGQLPPSGSASPPTSTSTLPSLAAMAQKMAPGFLSDQDGAGLMKDLGTLDTSMNQLETWLTPGSSTRPPPGESIGVGSPCGSAYLEILVSPPGASSIGSAIGYLNDDGTVSSGPTIAAITPVPSYAMHALSDSRQADKFKSLVQFAVGKSSNQVLVVQQLAAESEYDGNGAAAASTNATNEIWGTLYSVTAQTATFAMESIATIGGVTAHATESGTEYFKDGAATFHDEVQLASDGNQVSSYALDSRQIAKGQFQYIVDASKVSFPFSATFSKVDFVGAWTQPDPKADTWTCHIVTVNSLVPRS